MKLCTLLRPLPLAGGIWLLAIFTTWAQSDPPAAAPPAQTDAADAAFIPRLQQHGFTAEQTTQVLACLADARRQGIPATALTLRLEEGLAKNIEPARLLAGLQARSRAMLQARTLVQTANYDMVPGGPCDDLLLATGLAIESGVPAADLGGVLQRGGGRFALRMASIVEAGESLYLAGVDPDTTRALMNDCLDRDLRRMEVLRAVRYTIQQHRGGMDGDNIRRALWGGQAAREDSPGWHGGRGNGRFDNSGGGSMGPGYGGGRGHVGDASQGPAFIPTAPGAGGNSSGNSTMGNGSGSSGGNTTMGTGSPSGNGNGSGNGSNGNGGSGAGSPP